MIGRVVAVVVLLAAAWTWLPLQAAVPAAVVFPEATAEPGPAVVTRPVTVVNPEQVYTYEQMSLDLKALARAYPGLVELRSIGRTAFGRELWAARLGTGPATVLINASHHAREWLTTNLAMYMLDRYAAEAVTGGPVADLLSRVTIWFVPMVNPDGVTLHQQGLEAFPPEAREAILALNGGSLDFSGWKANAEGIDLNRQYPADWENICCNPAVPTFANHKGKEPLLAPEAKAMVDFTYAINPEVTVSYHATGRVLYWHFHNPPEHLARDRALAEQFGAIAGYVLVQPEENPSGGGYKDWFIQEFGRPGFTPEIAPYGDGSPPGPEHFAEEWERNKRIGLFVGQAGWELFTARSRVGLTIEGVAQKPGLLVGRQTFASLPDTLKALGIPYTWNEATGELVARRGGRSLTLTAGSADLPTAPLVIEGKLWGPVRVLADAFLIRLEWDGVTQTVHLIR